MLSSLRHTCGTVAAKVTGSQARRPRHRRLELEALEGRQVLSAYLGPEFLVNTKTSNDQLDSQNASSSNGMSVAVWVDTSSPTDHDIHAQLYDSLKLKWGSEITVSSTSNDERAPSVAMDAQGNFVVTWQTRVVGSTDADVVARRFDNMGHPLSNTFAVANSSKPEHHPDVAMDDTGNFVIGYILDFSSTNQDVWASRYSSSGVLLQSFAVAQTQSFETDVDVAITPNGRLFNIAYSSGSWSLDSEVDYDVFVNQYSAKTGLLRPPVAVASSTNVVEALPRISMDAFGNAVVAYSQRPVGGFNWDSKARRVSNSGVVGNEINIQSTTLDDTIASVALSRNGGAFVVAYDTTQFGNQIVGQVVAVSSSDVVGAPLNDVPLGLGPVVSIDGNDRFLLTYTSDGDIKGRFGHL